MNFFFRIFLAKKVHLLVFEIPDKVSPALIILVCFEIMCPYVTPLDLIQSTFRCA